jgi:hypothetical protein
MVQCAKERVSWSPMWFIRSCVALGALAAFAGCGGNDAEDPGGPRDSGAPGPGGPVALKNLSARLLRKYDCQLNGTLRSCGDYRFSFILQNSASVATLRMEQIELTLGALHARTSLGCMSAPWLASRESSTQVIDVWFNYLEGTNRLVTKFPCSAGVSWAADTGDPVAAPYTGTVTVRIRGLLTDATLWTAEGSADLFDAS